MQTFNINLISQLIKKKKLTYIHKTEVKNWERIEKVLIMFMRLNINPSYSF